MIIEHSAVVFHSRQSSIRTHQKTERILTLTPVI